MNKGALINGDIRSKTDVYIPVSEQLNIGENYIKGDANNLTYFSTIHTFFSQAGTSIATFDSASGITFAKDFIPTWTKNNSSVAAYQYEKIKIVAGKLPATTATAFTMAHGITDWHTIKSYTVAVHDDSSNVIVYPNTWSDQTSTGGRIYQIVYIDSLNCNARVPATGLNIRNDSIFFRIAYTDFQR